MPELPEIESLRLKLAPQLIHSQLTNLIFRRADLRYPLPVGRENEIMHSPITALRRRSKYLLCDFANGQTLILHLGMSGRFFFTEPDAPLHPHDHVLFDTDDQRHLRFRDPRRFGMLFFERTMDLPQNRFFKNLGVEPLENSFDEKKLYQLCQASTSPIKSLLMDASRVVGIGNIYANESLFLSRIHPQRRAQLVTRKEAKILCFHIKKVLQESIERGGTSFRDYVGADQKPGLYQLELFVYGRTLKPCRVCQTPIQRSESGGRGSFYCPSCQK